MQSGYVHVIWTSPMLQVNATSATQNSKTKTTKSTASKKRDYFVKRKKKKVEIKKITCNWTNY